MPSSRQRIFLFLTALILILLVSFYISQTPTAASISPVAAKIAGAKERLHQNSEAQNADLKKALERARESLKIATAAAAPAESAAAKAAMGKGEEKLMEQDGGKSGANETEMEGFAYVFYATSAHHACAALVHIHRLRHVLNSTLAIHILATPSVPPTHLSALRATGAVVHVLEPPPLPSMALEYYKDSLLKLRAFQLHEFAPELQRVMVLDVDQLLLRNLDWTFTSLPSADVIAPRAYWLPSNPSSPSNTWLSSTLILATLSSRLWQRVSLALTDAINVDAGGEVKYDMDLLNALFGSSAVVLGGEFVCLNSHWEDWNLPSWFHGSGREVNWTTVGRVNALAKVGGVVEVGKRGMGEDEVVEGESAVGKRQIFKTTDLPPPVGPVATPTIVPPPPPEVLQVQPQQAQPHTSRTALAQPPAVRPAPLGRPAAKTLSSPRFPLTHPLTLELDTLFTSDPTAGAQVIHFSAVGKPWTLPGSTVRQLRPDAHPLLAEMFDLWREVAEEVCPAGWDEGGVFAGEGGPRSWDPDAIFATGRAESTMSTAYARPLSGVGIAMATSV